jgi:hypothetical protein
MCILIHRRYTSWFFTASRFGCRQICDSIVLWKLQEFNLVYIILSQCSTSVSWCSNRTRRACDADTGCPLLKSSAAIALVLIVSTSFQDSIDDDIKFCLTTVTLCLYARRLVFRRDNVSYRRDTIASIPRSICSSTSIIFIKETEELAVDKLVSMQQ